MNEIEQMKTDMVSKLTTLLMEQNPGMSMEEALSEIFNSDTYRKLMNESTGLYHQSARYVYAFLQEELLIGKMI